MPHEPRRFGFELPRPGAGVTGPQAEKELIEACSGDDRTQQARGSQPVKNFAQKTPRQDQAALVAQRIAHADAGLDLANRRVSCSLLWAAADTEGTASYFSVRAISTKRSQGVATQVSVLAWPNDLTSKATLVALSVSGASKMSR